MLNSASIKNALKVIKFSKPENKSQVEGAGISPLSHFRGNYPLQNKECLDIKLCSVLLFS
jgi:hypothetical protein